MLLALKNMGDPKPLHMEGIVTVDSLLKNYDDDIILQDILLQWALNPTGATAGFEISKNRSCIKENLRVTHDLSAEQAEEVLRKVDIDLEKLGNHVCHDERITGAIGGQNYALFERFFVKKLKDAPPIVWNYLYILKIALQYSLAGQYFVEIAYRALWGSFPIEILVKTGLCKRLWWTNSKKTKSEYQNVLLPESFLKKFLNQVDMTRGDLTQKIIQILEFEMHEGKLPPTPDLLKMENFDWTIDEVDAILRLLKNGPAGSIINLIPDIVLKDKATEILKARENPSLYLLMTRFKCNYIEAEAVGYYLTRQPWSNVKSLPRIPSPTSWKAENGKPRELVAVRDSSVQLVMLRKIVNVSKVLLLDDLAKALKITRDELMGQIFDWAVEFGFEIDENKVVFGVGRKDDFIAELEREFVDWGKASKKN